jgi:hypothetical protein
MTAISNRTAAVTVEFDAKKGRTTKHFEDAAEAKRFFAAKDKAGKNPKVIGDATAAQPVKAKGGKAKTAATTETMPATTATATTEEPAAVKPPRTPGVATTVMSRPYCAGLVIQRHGLTIGVTPEMAAEVDAMYRGKANPRESNFCLRNAHHAIRAYLEANGAA